ncbi:hypothetical protein MMC18_004956 [Xylographa bjoerkii]|nr:hypothetical protein [Xylographa bjoerkii]
MVTTQEELAKVASQVGQSFELTTKMVNSEFAILDLEEPWTRSEQYWIRELTIEELGVLPQYQRLRAIWDQIAPNEDYALFKSHAQLLEELVSSHETISAVIKYIITALLRVEAELERIRNNYATLALIMQDDPIDDVLETFETAAMRLTAAKTGLDQGGGRLELGGRALTSA